MAPVLTSPPSSSSSSLLETSLARGSAQINNYPDQLRSTPIATSPPAQDPSEVVRLDSLRHATTQLDARNYKHSSFTLELLEILRRLHVPAWSQDTRLKPQDVLIRKVSGALTNAVFFVSAPTVPSLRTLLLRIYGPSSGSLISRPRELRILHVLSSRYKIGPRVYGTFANGRIEEYFDSVTLTSPDIRNPEISRWIGARMAELHSVDIPTVEGPDWRRKLAPYGFQIATNVKSWLDPAEDVLKLDCVSDQTRRAFDLDRFKQEWQRYIDWATNQPKSIGKRRVFGHNDAQYGNLLRLNDAKRELALAEHRQIIVVDFEYAAPNPAAYDIANHFHEWSANYHGPNPHLLDPSLYPTLEERRNFYAAYIQHGRANNSDDGPVGEGNSPFTMSAAMRSSSSLNLSALATESGPGSVPGGTKEIGTAATLAPVAAATEEAEGGKTDDALIDELEESVQVWSPASHAGWAIWGIVQARDDLEAAAASASIDTSDPSAPVSTPSASSSPATPSTIPTPALGDTQSQSCTTSTSKEDPKSKSKTVASELPATTLAPSSSSPSSSSTIQTNPAWTSSPRPVAATTTTIHQSEITASAPFGSSAVSTGTTVTASDEPNKLRACNHGEQGGRQQQRQQGVAGVTGVTGGGVGAAGCGNSGADGVVVVSNANFNGRNGCDASGAVQLAGGGGVGGGGCGVAGPALIAVSTAPSVSAGTTSWTPMVREDTNGVPGQTCCCMETSKADFDYIGYAYGRMLAFRRDLERLGI